MEKQVCSNCKKECIKHAKGMCVTCYKRLAWVRKKGICKRCNRELFIHAKGLCGGCYNTTFHLEATKDKNYKKYHNIEPALYREITKKCLLCDFDKTIDLHHLDKNRKNNSLNNMIGLCPNHHALIHNLKYKDETTAQIKEKLALKQPTKLN